MNKVNTLISNLISVSFQSFIFVPTVFGLKVNLSKTQSVK